MREFSTGLVSPSANNWHTGSLVVKGTICQFFFHLWRHHCKFQCFYVQGTFIVATAAVSFISLDEHWHYRILDALPWFCPFMCTEEVTEWSFALAAWPSDKSSFDCLTQQHDLDHVWLHLDLLAHMTRFCCPTLGIIISNDASPWVISCILLSFHILTFMRASAFIQS
jgi:hypothetical protein